MRAKILAASFLCAAAALAVCAVCFLLSAPHAARHIAQAQHTDPAAQVTPANPAATLFPDLHGMHITSLCVSTPDRSFQFHMDRQGGVSVNGQQADSEIFSTLLDQIAALPVETCSAFNPRSQDPILTLVVSSGTHQQTARFYEGGAKGEKAHIVLGTDESPEYRKTNGWRVGTLMMTCEGTRILDIHGNETPAMK